MSNRRLLIERIEQPEKILEALNPQKVQSIIEENNGKLIVTFQLQRADEVNANGRVYPKKILENQLEKYQKLIKGNASTGELDHPDNAIVSLANVAHRIVEAFWDSDNIIGRVQVLNTWAGQQARALLEDGITLGISSRAIGSTKRSTDGYDVVQDDLMLIAWDLVSSPSTPGSWQLDEGKNHQSNIIIPESTNKYFNFVNKLQEYQIRHKDNLL